MFNPASWGGNHEYITSRSDEGLGGSAGAAGGHPQRMTMGFRLTLNASARPAHFAGIVDTLAKAISALQTVEVLYAIAQINAWNRLAIAGGLGGLIGGAGSVDPI